MVIAFACTCKPWWRLPWASGKPVILTETNKLFSCSFIKKSYKKKRNSRIWVKIIKYRLCECDYSLKSKHIFNLKKKIFKLIKFLIILISPVITESLYIPLKIAIALPPSLGIHFEINYKKKKVYDTIKYHLITSMQSELSWGMHDTIPAKEISTNASFIRFILGFCENFS